MIFRIMEESHKWVNYYFKLLTKLESEKQSLSLRMNCNRACLYEARQTAQEILAGVKGEQGYSTVLTQQNDVLRKKLAETDHQVAEIRATLNQAGEFDTKKLTKYLANVLTHNTKGTWLPIRYLLEPATHFTPQKEAYGLLLADSIYCLPDLPETFTLLDHKHYNQFERSDIKYRESDDKPIVYKNIDSMDHIWMFGSWNFISVGTEEKYNAFFNTNSVTNKPFLHLCLSEENAQLLRTISDENTPCYRNYQANGLSENHPRKIVLNALADLVDARLDKVEAEHTLNTSSATPTPEAYLIRE